MRRLFSLFALSVPLMAQTPKPEAFDVVSIKPNLSGANSTSMSSKQGRFTATNVTLRALILSGFHVQDFQAVGGPGWLESERFDVAAKTDNTAIGDDDLWRLLQPMLAERFRLKVHRGTKDSPVYALIAGKGKPKLTPHVGAQEPSVRVSSGSGKATINAVNLSMAGLAERLSRFNSRIVIDRTSLAGGFDFRLEWAQEHSESMVGAIQETLGLGGPTIFTAVQEQLGLKLESARAPVETIFIDSAERPSPN